MAEMKVNDTGDAVEETREMTPYPAEAGYTMYSGKDSSFVAGGTYDGTAYVADPSLPDWVERNTDWQAACTDYYLPTPVKHDNLSAPLKKKIVAGDRVSVTDTEWTALNTEYGS